MAVSVSFPAKAIITGEHLVLHDQPAWVTACPSVNLRLQLTPLQSHTIVLAGQEIDRSWQMSQLADQHEPLPLAVRGLLFLIKRSDKLSLPGGWQVKIDSQIPIGAGMGSSAAVSLALVTAWNKLFQLNWSQEQIFDLARQIESFQHGRSSGVDIRAIQLQKSLVFLPGGMFRSLPLLTTKLHLVHTGMPEQTTGQMVEWVASVRQQPNFKPLWQELIDLNIQVITQAEYESRFDVESWDRMGQLWETMGLVSDSGREFAAQIRAQKGFCKVSGAGGRAQGSGLMLSAGISQADIKPLAQEFGFQYLGELII